MNMKLKEILEKYELISFCKDICDVDDDKEEYVLNEISMIDDTYVDMNGEDHKAELKVGDFEIFDIEMQNTYGFCRCNI